MADEGISRRDDWFGFAKLVFWNWATGKTARTDDTEREPEFDYLRHEIIEALRLLLDKLVGWIKRGFASDTFGVMLFT